MQVPVPSIRSRNPAVPANVEDAIRRALAHDPAERFPTAGAFAEAIDASLPGVDGTAAATAVPPVAGPISASDSDDATALAADDRTMIAPAAGAAAGAAVAGAAAGAAGRARTPTPASASVAPARPGPAIPPPRRRAAAQPRTGTPPIVWVLLVLALLAAGGAIWYAASGGSGLHGRPLSDLPDSALKDTTRIDTLTAADAPKLDRQGFGALNAGQFAQAADLYREAMELDPGRAEYKDHLAFALIRQGQYTEAVALLEQATRQDPNYDLSYSHLGEARLALGDTMGAVVALRRFLDVSVNQHDRAIAQATLDRLLAPHPAAPPAADTSLAPVDTAGAPPARPAAPPSAPPSPRDSIRLGPP
jgi:hypothetical protein